MGPISFDWGEDDEHIRAIAVSLSNIFVAQDEVLDEVAAFDEG